MRASWPYGLRENGMDLILEVRVCSSQQNQGRKGQTYHFAYFRSHKQAMKISAVGHCASERKRGYKKKRGDLV
jgi:hypothetical protein